MSDNCISEVGKTASAIKSFVADEKTPLEQSFEWFDGLMDALFKGRGDKEKTVLGRLADAADIPESYAFRLKYKREEMREINGRAYRGLMLAYVELCLKHEQSASDKKSERMEISDEIDQSRSNGRLRNRAPQNRSMSVEAA